MGSIAASGISTPSSGTLTGFTEVTIATLGITDAITSAARCPTGGGDKQDTGPPLLHDRDALAREYARKPASTTARELGSARAPSPRPCDGTACSLNRSREDPVQ